MGPAEQAPGGLPFIISTDRKKPDGQVRKLIRSHVMKGKNKGKVYRDKRSGTKRAGREARAPGDKGDAAGSSSPDGTSCCPPPGGLPLPKKVGSDISFFQPADDTIEPSLLLPVLKFSSMAKRAMFRLEPRVIFQETAKGPWCELLATDAAYLNAVVYAAHMYFDLVAGLKPEDMTPSRPACRHLSRSLQMLRERLSDETNEDRLSDSTVMIVLSLASHASGVGQRKTAISHLEGLRRIVTLRGGVAKFRANPKLLIQIFRCDLSEALTSGAKPYFFHDPTAEPFMPYLDQLAGFIPACYYSSTCQPLQGLELGIGSPELCRAWDTTRTFCALLNYATESRRKIPQETLLNTMASVMYRLLYLSFPADSLDEIIRLGLLGFCSNIFLQWSEVKLPYPHLSRQFKGCLCDLSIAIAPYTMLWVLVSGSISLCTEEDDKWLTPWVQTTADICGARTWSQCRDILKGFLWIDFIHDELGRKLFASWKILDASPSSSHEDVGIEVSGNHIHETRFV